MSFLSGVQPLEFEAFIASIFLLSFAIAFNWAGSLLLKHLYGLSESAVLFFFMSGCVATVAVIGALHLTQSLALCIHKYNDLVSLLVFSLNVIVVVCLLHLWRRRV